MKYLNIIILILFVVSAGCGKKIKTANTDSIGLPADYPSEFAKPDNGVVLSVDITKDGTSVMFRIETPAEELIGNYRKSASDAGYEEQNDMKPQSSGNEIAALFVRKKDGRNVSVSITSGKENKSTVTVLYK